VLGDLAVLDPEQVIEASGFAGELAFADDEDEVALSEHAMNAVILRHDASFGPRFERRGQIRNAIGDKGMVLNVPITVAVARELVHLPATTRNIGEYARQLGYSARTLNRSALRNTGLTVKQLLDQRTLLEAKRLLAHDTAPVQAVGRAVGFAEPTTFTRFFRHRTGVTPLEFRTTRIAPRAEV
jgi:AraC-like DNA-binding protein